MHILNRLLQSIGFSKIIKIPGKSNFDELSIHEVGLLIDSFFCDGNEEFDALAFNEFLHAKLRNERLKRIQRDLNENAFIDSDDDEWPKINENYLRQLARTLKADH
jgi:hypothetical protein